MSSKGPLSPPPLPERQKLDAKIMNCSSTGSHSVDSEPRQLIIHNPRGLGAAEIGLMGLTDATFGFVVNAPPSRSMGEVPKKTWGQLAREWTVEEKKKEPGGGGDGNWQVGGQFRGGIAKI